jgi:hypothetical protein
MGGGSNAAMLVNRTGAVMLLNRTRGAVWALKPPINVTRGLLYINHLCTCELYRYSPVRNAFDAGSIHYLGKWEGVRPWKS